ncbi:response regulator [Palleronia pelagia]|uniref:Response regulator receiver domain-containing protein n=1 Tax=Palleronia pelagia TaxID=387096 RepID=A0A1H8HC38_9RHOB|nr:response regulator [Palleronia pelagia]SEN53831.1 Response regulator receiver domain-containing protein [Palleronia pelagia]
MKVLFMDDEADIRELIEFAIMVEDDIDATFVGSGIEAIDLLKEEHFDLLLLDVMMPPPDGLEVLRVARADEKFRASTIVMCTARTSSEAEEELRKLGADHVLHKPFKPLKLAEFIRSVA